MTKYIHVDTDGAFYHVYYSIGKRDGLTWCGRYKSLHDAQEKVEVMTRNWERATNGDTKITFDLRGRGNKTDD